MKKRTEKKEERISHTSVMREEAVGGLGLKKAGTAIDATAGLGGHAEMMASAVGPRGTLMVIDADQESLTKTRERLKDAKAKIIFVRGNFRNLKRFAEEADLADVAGVLFDLGWHAGQLASGRGLSFTADEPLLMTLETQPEPGQLTAKDIIAGWDEEEIARLIREYGEERFARRIAKGIVEARRRRPIRSARELADVIAASVPAPYRYGRLHPATRTFQALRIAVNDELGALTEALEAAIALVAKGGRVAAISFHSLEDRIVKRAFRSAEDQGVGERITKKPMTPSAEERTANPRARSAKLRIFEKNHDAS
ncbi:MAG: 16S rRNA (cytosine(1402)-N(4))-methyltransferase RsmH [Patescibacteria group bacterium]